MMKKKTFRIPTSLPSLRKLLVLQHSLLSMQTCSILEHNIIFVHFDLMYAII